MFNCEYCDLIFEEKRLLLSHQRSKKCLTHRAIGFVCQKCFKNIIGYDNTIKHVDKCDVKHSGEGGELTALMSQLSLYYQTDLIFTKSQSEGQINFKRLQNYFHPKKLINGVCVPSKPHLFFKTMNRLNISQILGSHGLYLNDVFSQIFRLSDAFQFLSVKYDLKTLLSVLWFETSTSCFYLKENEIFVLGRIQCKNSDGKKWFGDTFVLEGENEKISKLLWFKDPQLQSFFSNLTPLLKDVLNLYLVLGNWALKQKKIRLKPTFPISLDQIQSNDVLISKTMEEFNLSNLVENIKKLSSFETFFQIFKDLFKVDGHILHSNIKHEFKDEMFPSSFINEEFSFMTLRDPELTGGNFYFLLHHILPEDEKIIFRSKTPTGV